MVACPTPRFPPRRHVAMMDETGTSQVHSDLEEKKGATTTLLLVHPVFPA